MAKIEISKAPLITGSNYPEPYHVPCRERARRALGDAAGLSHFGVNLQRIAPGGWSSLRHWHSEEDEFLWVVSGDVVMVTDSGEEHLTAGDCAGFRAGQPNGHHLQNRSETEAWVLEVGSRHPERDVVSYADVDLRFAEDDGYTHKDGQTY